jgi:hypothetical protein
MDMANHLDPAHSRNELAVSIHSIKQNLVPINVPDPEPGWAALHPERALAFLYISPRPCSAIDELMKL